MIHRLILVLVFLISIPVGASAQEARSFEQLQLLVKRGDRIYVTDSTGVEKPGRIDALSTSSLRLMMNGSVRDMSESDVFKIRQWRYDSLKNGALIGAGIGFGMSLTATILLCHEDYNCGWNAVGIVAAYTGIGAGIGVGIDAMVPQKQIIYFGGPRTALSRFKVKPILGSGRKGVAVSVSF